MIKNKPEAYGISSDNLLCMVQELETFVEDIHSISVVCDNDVIFSKCIQPYTEEPMQMLHSFSKSMNSIAVGIAIDEGKLHLDDLVIDYFKEYLPEEYDKRIDQLTVRNLLTMAANSCRLSTCFRGVTDSWITHYFTYKLPHDPGTVFQYDTGASYMLSSLVTKTMHKNVLALMKERVLKPMGITDIEWLESPEGNTVGGWGLYLKTPDIAKIAILLANMGKWNGKTLIPEEYLKEATRKQIDTPEEKYPVCGYGYQYWITADHSFGVYGAFGNVIVVNPEKKLAVAITAGASDKNGNPNRLISKIVNEKLFIPTERGTLETDVDGEKKLKKYLDDLVYNQTLVDRVEDADLSRNVDERVLKGRWQKPGDHTFFKDIASRDRTEVTSRFVQDENVLQFKSLSLSYSFPQKWIKKMYMERMKLTFQMEDLFRISTVKRERGLDYPFARTFNFGLQVQF